METDGKLRGCLVASDQARALIAEIGGVPHVSASTISRWCRKGYRGRLLPCRKFGLRSLFYEQDVRDFAALLVAGVPEKASTPDA